MKRTIYLDNSSTTLHKPEAVYDAVMYALKNFGNPSRAFYDESLNAMRAILDCRIELAKLVKLDSINKIAFTSSATESLNLVIGGVITENDHVLTTPLEHNAVLRPLYLSKCQLDVIECDQDGVLLYDAIESLIRPNTRALVTTHGSNVLGNVVDLYRLKEICHKHNIILIADVSQTLGAIEVLADMADVICFTGHKSLFGPQGTGGVIVNGDINFKICKTGGTGANTFQEVQLGQVPECFEVGTLNSHCLNGLKAGISYINECGVHKIQKKLQKLTSFFYNELSKIDGITIYGDFSTTNRLATIAINIDGYASFEVAEILHDDFNIAVRAQHHCAPLVHGFFNTQLQGMVRFSFSYFTEIKELEQAISALQIIAYRKENINEHD